MISWDKDSSHHVLRVTVEKICGPLLTVPWKVMAEAPCCQACCLFLVLHRWCPDRKSLVLCMGVCGALWEGESGCVGALCVCGVHALCVGVGALCMGGVDALCVWGVGALCVRGPGAQVHSTHRYG